MKGNTGRNLTVVKFELKSKKKKEKIQSNHQGVWTSLQKRLKCVIHRHCLLLLALQSMWQETRYIIIPNGSKWAIVNQLFLYVHCLSIPSLWNVEWREFPWFVGRRAHAALKHKKKQGTTYFLSSHLANPNFTPHPMQMLIARLPQCLFVETRDQLEESKKWKQTK